VATTVLSFGCAPETAHPLANALSERNASSPLLLAGRENQAPLQGTDLATARPADFGQLPYVPHFTSRKRPVRNGHFAGSPVSGKATSETVQ
jgi:hypothetical protein